MKSDKSINNWILWAFFGSISLGLAPFTPEPHIVGKIRWVLGGAVGMQTIDWFDLVFHGAPWAALLILLLVKLYMIIKERCPVIDALIPDLTTAFNDPFIAGHFP